MEERETHRSEDLHPAQLLHPVFLWWRLVVVCTVTGAVCGFVVSLLLPRVYESRATVFPQQSRDFASFLSQLPIPLNARGTSSGYYTALLKSDTLLIQTVKKLNLLRNRHFANGEVTDICRAVRRLRKAVSIKENRDGSVSIVVRAQDPHLAAEIANTMLDLLGGLVQTASKRKVTFISRKLQDTARELRQAEDEMRRFLEVNDIAAIDEQSKAIVQELAELDGKLLAADVELREISSRLQNAGDLELLIEDEVRKRALESSRELIVRRKAELQKKFSLLPKVATQYGRLKRRVELLGQTYSLLTQQYQLERITQQGEGGDYQVIDRARADRQKVAPRTLLNTALSGLIGFIVAVVAATLWAPIESSRRAQ